MLRSWKLGTAFGIGIYVHATFLVLPILVLFLTIRGGAAQVLYFEVLTVALFGCVVFHELGHALMARFYGIGTRDITLYPIGGVARLERMSEQPWEEFWISLAGPAVNVVIAGILLGALQIGSVRFTPETLLAALQLDYGDTPWKLGQYVFGARILIGLLAANLFLASFNLLPAFPMDGGRILRAVLAMNVNRLLATEVAVAIGMMFAGLFGLLGVVALFLQGNPLFALLGAFVFFAGQQELAVLRHREAARREEPIDVLPVEEYIPDQSPVAPEPNFSGFTWDRRARAWIEWRNGRPVHRCWVDSE